mmetsp:Transcript_21112/g.46031  ORF Transcript_21112/g.46031 Transcript_21112/m.46031 type:complete len:233 (-) Transcript_21112:142-840(-)
MQRNRKLSKLGGASLAKRNVLGRTALSEWSPLVTFGVVTTFCNVSGVVTTSGNVSASSLGDTGIVAAIPPMPAAVPHSLTSCTILLPLVLTGMAADVVSSSSSLIQTATAPCASAMDSGADGDSVPSRRIFSISASSTAALLSSSAQASARCRWATLSASSDLDSRSLSSFFLDPSVLPMARDVFSFNSCNGASCKVSIVRDRLLLAMFTSFSPLLISCMECPLCDKSSLLA